MTLYVNGDSHSQGVNVQAEQSFAHILAKEFGLDLINQSQSGASNARILRTTKEYLATEPCTDLIIVGWSTWEREEWHHDNQYYNVNSSGHDPLPQSLEQAYKKWVIDQTPDHVDDKSRSTHEQIFDLHVLMQEKNIPHVFFNCMYNFFGIAPDQKKNWNNCYIDPYDNDSSYYWYLARQGHARDQWYHFGASGHRAWAHRLIDHIREHSLL